MTSFQNILLTLKF